MISYNEGYIEILYYFAISDSASPALELGGYTQEILDGALGKIS